MLEPYMFLEKNICVNETVNDNIVNLSNNSVLSFFAKTENNENNTKNDYKKCSDEQNIILSVNATEDVCKKLNIKVKKNDIQNKKMTIFYPNKPDKLFWCIYVSLYGFKEYDQIGLHYGNKEIEEKQKLIEFMKKDPSILKTSPKRITKTLQQELMSDFMTNKKITMDMLLVIAIYYKKQIYVININEKAEPNKCYLRVGIYENNVTNDNIIVIYKNKNNYSLEMENNENKMNEILEKLYCIYQSDKPLKAITNYKIDELENIALKLNIDLTKKMKKQELYNEILKNLDFWCL